MLWWSAEKEIAIGKIFFWLSRNVTDCDTYYGTDYRCALTTDILKLPCQNHLHWVLKVQMESRGLSQAVYQPIHPLFSLLQNMGQLVSRPSRPQSNLSPRDYLLWSLRVTLMGYMSAGLQPTFTHQFCWNAWSNSLSVSCKNINNALLIFYSIV